jgi:hypothetical protein
MQPITQEYDASTDTLTIERVKYSGELFRQLGGALPIGAPFRIVKRENGKTARKFRSDCKAVAASIYSFCSFKSNIDPTVSDRSES